MCCLCHVRNTNIRPISKAFGTRPGGWLQPRPQVAGTSQGLDMFENNTENGKTCLYNLIIFCFCGCCVCGIIHPSIYPFIHPSTHPPIHSSIHPSIHPSRQTDRHRGSQRPVNIVFVWVMVNTPLKNISQRFENGGWTSRFCIWILFAVCAYI